MQVGLRFHDNNVLQDLLRERFPVDTGMGDRYALVSAGGGNLSSVSAVRTGWRHTTADVLVILLS